MRFSTKFKASSHCLPSPDGRLVATLLPSRLQIRPVDDLYDASFSMPLPLGMAAASIVGFQWSPSSRRVLVATADLIVVVAAQAEDAGAGAGTETGSETGAERDAGEAGTHFRQAVISHAALPAGDKPAFVGFGANDDQVCLCSALGLKLVLYHLQAGKAVEMLSPKLHGSPAVCARGFAFRPGSHHLALLTRPGGKDCISVHDPVCGAVADSWTPDTVDAQGLRWSPDGRWLLVWESPAHGHKLLLYTPDGHLFKRWPSAVSASIFLSDGSAADDGADSTDSREKADNTDEADLAPGFRLAQFSPNARLLAAADASRCVCLLGLASILQPSRLLHPATLCTQTHHSYQVWQEQTSSSGERLAHTFVEASQAVSPPGRPVSTSSEAAALLTGCAFVSFDSSSSMLATRLDEAPTTVWLWDIEAAQLSAVLMFHGYVASIVWHPAAPRTLLVTCEGDGYRDVAFFWTAASGPPQVVDFASHPHAAATDTGGAARAAGRAHHPIWLNADGQPPTLFYSDGKDFCFACLGGEESGGVFATSDGVPWPQVAPNKPPGSAEPWLGDSRASREESPLELVPAQEALDDDSELEDTFHYKREERA